MNVGQIMTRRMDCALPNRSVKLIASKLAPVYLLALSLTGYSHAK